MRYIRQIKELFEKDYRHAICFVITFVSILCGLLFPNALPRLFEALRDLITSLVYYFLDILGFRVNPIYPTVIDFQEWQFCEQIWEPIKLLPETWDEFLSFWESYLELLFTQENLLLYFMYIGNFIYYLSQILITVLPIVPILIPVFNSQKNKHCTERGKKSPKLQKFEKFLFTRVYPVQDWCRGFIEFIFTYSAYIKIWFLLWSLYFNLFSIVISFVAFYLYFIASWDILNIYLQILKFQRDLTPVIRFIPGLIWGMLGAWIYNRICESVGYQELYHAEECNKAVFRERGVSTVLCGPMRIGKTQIITDMGLTGEVVLFEYADDIMTAKEHMFPNYPWQILRDELKRRIALREIVDLPTCRKWVQRARRYFDKAIHKYTPDELKAKRNYSQFLVFGYDYEHYRHIYNDGLKLIHLYEALEDYACAYMMYTIQTTLLFANYSIRVDSILEDTGNMPRRNNDFFSRDPEELVLYSKHAHIIDQDMIRLGTKMINDNEKARRLSYGGYIISEIDKERKNMLELKETKINSAEANQRNDMFNAAVMMSGHANVVDYHTFIFFLFDLQRAEAWGAGGRELGEVVYIASKDELAPVLPWYSPYWFFQGIYKSVQHSWDRWKRKYKENRSDLTLLVYLIDNTLSIIGNHYDKIEGIFGMQMFNLEIQRGSLDGNITKEKWRLLTKKARSKRYRTDCLEGVFQSKEPNKMHIDDYQMYSGEIATPEELEMQNSYFQNDIKKMKGGNS